MLDRSGNDGAEAIDSTDCEREASDEIALHGQSELM
jgi:hypothetical protein